MKHRVRALPRRQRGATLIIALIFMVILAMLGASVASNNTMQERMASNTRNRDLAFQAAELAVRTAEANMLAGSNYGTAGNVGQYANPPTTAGLWTGFADNYSANDWRGFAWTTASYAITPANVAGNDVAARYLVERLTPVAGSRYYRITARGTGPNNSVAIVQIIYRAN
jgi:type IV pilus assembly protein PilX